MLPPAMKGVDMSARCRAVSMLSAVAVLLALAGCGQAAGTPAKPPAPEADEPAATQPASGSQSRIAVLAGGCFWCVETVLQRVKGVEKVVSGYAGGKAENAQYRLVARGQTDHAESVEVTYDPSVITYGQLLRIFFATHHPTQLNRQGPDVGKQYRSAIFYANERQKRIAENYITQLNESGIYDKPIATTLEKLDGFYPAKAYHQDYVQKNPRDAYVQQYVPPKLEKLTKFFPERVKEGAGEL
jgi:peptide-methionine (S)-S-oxide reductase